MSPEHPLESRLSQAWPTPAWIDTHLAVAVSGGPDSVALLRAILAIKQRKSGAGVVHVAHFNHRLRGEAADEDEAWLGALCRGLRVPLEIGRADALDLTNTRGDSSEAVARSARYHFLCETAEKLGARYVAVAHTADDQVETVLHRFLRGTGLDGLAGMPASRPLSPSVVLVRPLLGVGRLAVLRYLQDIGQSYRVEGSNKNLRWTRNRLRHELLPALREGYNQQVDDALLRLSAQAGEVQSIIVQLASELAGTCVSVEKTGSGTPATAALRVVVDCRPLRATPPLLVREVCKLAWQQAGWPLQAMGFEEWQQLEELIHEKRMEPVDFPGNIRARRDAHQLLLELQLE
jgi:tRNA(Ile)-lysidine synthase